MGRVIDCQTREGPGNMLTVTLAVYNCVVFLKGGTFYTQNVPLSDSRFSKNSAQPSIGKQGVCFCKQFDLSPKIAVRGVCRELQCLKHRPFPTRFRIYTSSTHTHTHTHTHTCKHIAQWSSIGAGFGERVIAFLKKSFELLWQQFW